VILPDLYLEGPGSRPKHCLSSGLAEDDNQVLISVQDPIRIGRYDEPQPDVAMR
jgi:hypothetical protein